MAGNQALIEDLLKLAENALGNVLGARHEFGAQAREKISRSAGKFGFVAREEFDVAMAMIGKARLMQEELNARLHTIESKLGITAPKQNAKKNPLTSKTGKNPAAKNLRSVKQAKRAARRG